MVWLMISILKANGKNSGFSIKIFHSYRGYKVDFSPAPGITLTLIQKVVSNKGIYYIHENTDCLFSLLHFIKVTTVFYNYTSLGILEIAKWDRLQCERVITKVLYCKFEKTLFEPQHKVEE